MQRLTDTAGKERSIAAYLRFVHDALDRVPARPGVYYALVEGHIVQKLSVGSCWQVQGPLLCTADPAQVAPLAMAEERAASSALLAIHADHGAYPLSFLAPDAATDWPESLLGPDLIFIVQDELSAEDSDLSVKTFLLCEVRRL